MKDAEKSKKLEDDPLGLFGPETGKTWEWNRVVHGVGVICIEFQILETVIKTAIGRFVDKDDPLMGSAITAGLSFKASVDTLYAFIRIPMGGFFLSKTTPTDSGSLRGRRKQA